jgi:hypothetical protein
LASWKERFTKHAESAISSNLYLFSRDINCEEKSMRKIIVLALLIVLPLGTFSYIYGNFAKNVKIQSSTSSSNIIDHLPFTINTTDVYHLTQDLRVNGTGITILANNAVLLGHGHTITGNGTEGEFWTNIGVDVQASDVVVYECNIRSFRTAIAVRQDRTMLIHNILSGSLWGILAEYSIGLLVKDNIIVGNWGGIGFSTPIENDAVISNNYFQSLDRNAYQDYPSSWNSTRSSGQNVIGGPYLGGNYWHDYLGNDTDDDGLGNTNLPYNSNGHIYVGGDYLPLVDILSPCYELVAFDYAFPSTTLNITWKDNVQLDRVILELDGTNYTDLVKSDESFGFDEYYQVENRAVYSRSFTNLSLGAHYYKWFANDTRNNWNSTQLLSFNVTAIPQIVTVAISPILEVTANITCEGVNNITEIMDCVRLHFKMDENWFAMNMNYNPETSLYSALIPAYNQLANKTIQYYVEALDKNGYTITSTICSSHVPEWAIADLNRNGEIDQGDVETFQKYYNVDIAITKITLSNPSPKINETIKINVTITNLGDITQTFNLTLNYTRRTDPIIGTQIATLEPEQAKTITFTWTPTLTGNYILTAYTNTIPLDKNLENNIKQINLYIGSGSTQSSSTMAVGGLGRLLQFL